jgi:hypothetical protein
MPHTHTHTYIQRPLLRTYLNREVEADLKAVVVVACKAELEANEL